MSHTTTTIAAPVSVADVNYVLGAGSLDVGTLCTHGNINPFALYCPRRTTVPGLILNESGFNTIAGWTSQRPDSSYACPAYGVWVPSLPVNNMANSSTFFSNIFSAASKEWYISRPDASSFNCLQHFDKYSTAAHATKPIIVSTASKRTAGGITLSVTLTTPAPDGISMSVSNLFGGKGWYFGIIAFRGTSQSGWTTSDTILVGGSETAISNIAQTTTAITIDDTSANSEGVYYYRIIPFVCNKANVSTSNVTDTTYYGLKISSDFQGVIEVSVNGTISGSGDEQIEYFNWKEGNNNSKPGVSGNHYPDPAGTSLPDGLTTPGVSIAYGEYFNSHYTNLWTKYNQVDMDFSCYTRDGEHIMRTYTWRKSGALAADNVLTRDTRFDSTGGYENKLFFYIPISAIRDILNSCDEGQIEVLGRFHYNDWQYGYSHVDDAFATYIPDVTGN